MTTELPDETASPCPKSGEVELFWQEAKKHLGLDRADVVVGTPVLAQLQPDAFIFGGDQSQTEELLSLVLAGVKRATTSAYCEYINEDLALPCANSLAIICDFRGSPQALIRIDQVRVCDFDDIDQDYASREGEGDLSLEYWQRTHSQFFAEIAGYDQDRRVVCEYFTCIYPRPQK